jgi:colanic acid biosynthesis glycosyl transferase WcaI
MKILIHGLNFNPEIVGIGKYTGELAEWLAQSGHEVRVITTPPYYPNWKVQPPYKGWQYKTETWQGVKIIRCPLWVPQKPSGVTRILHLLSFSFSSFPALLGQLRWKPDVILNVSPTLFSAPFTLFTAGLTKAKSWLHIQDFELDAASNLGMIKPGSVINKLATSWEKSVLTGFEIVSSISTRMVSLLISKGVSTEKVLLFPNWVDTEAIYPLKKQGNSYRIMMGITDDQTVVLYSGNMGYKQGLDLIIETAKLLEDNNQIVFLMCGNGAGRPALEIQAQDLKNIKFLDLQPLERLNELLNAADIHLLPQQANAADLVMPSKLSGMMASGKPIIATANPETELAEVVNQIGIVIPPNDPDSAMDAILRLTGSPELQAEYGVKSREMVCINWSRKTVLESFLLELK